MSVPPVHPHSGEHSEWNLTWKFTGGGGFFGSILTTLDSTFGGGRKLFFPTWSRQESRFKHACFWTGGSLLVLTTDPPSRAKAERADLHEMVDPGQQLCVDGQSAVQLVSRRGHQPHSELPLEHQHGAPEQTQTSSWTTCKHGAPPLFFKSFSQDGLFSNCYSTTDQLSHHTLTDVSFSKIVALSSFFQVKSCCLQMTKLYDYNSSMKNIYLYT